MSNVTREVTSSGILGIPEGGVSGIIVPGAGMSTSIDGPPAQCSAGCAGEVTPAKVFPPQICRGKSDYKTPDGFVESTGEAHHHAEPTPPGRTLSSRPGPKSFKEKEKGQERGKQEESKIVEEIGRDHHRMMEDQEKDGELDNRGADMERPMEMEADNDRTLTVSLDVQEIARGAKDAGRKALRTTSRSHPMSCIVSEVTLRGDQRIRLPSPAAKRPREKLEGEDSDASDVLMASSQAETLHKRKRGRPAKNPENEGQYTAEEIQERARERKREEERERIKEQEREERERKKERAAEGKAEWERKAKEVDKEGTEKWEVEKGKTGTRTPHSEQRRRRRTPFAYSTRGGRPRQLK